MWRAMLLAVTAGVSVGCGRPTDGAGQLEAEWRGAARGQFATRVTATHCPESGVLLLEGVRADSGVALALFPVDPAVVVAGTYPVTAGAASVLPRPGAVAAFRAFNGVELRGWESYDGSVMLDGVGGELGGRLELRLRAVEGLDTLQFSGRFTGVPLTRDSVGCAAVLRRSG